MKSAILKIHLAVFLFGAAGLFGKYLSLPPDVIVFGRVFFAAVALFIILLFAGNRISLQAKDLPILILLGLLLAVHWTSFFASIQRSSVSIGLISFSTFPFFVLMIESYLHNGGFSLKDLVLSILMILGAAFLIPEWSLENDVTSGFIIGIFASITFAIISVLNRRYVQRFGSIPLAFYQMLIAAIFLFPIAIQRRASFSSGELFILLMLGVVFTALSHSLFISGMKKITAYRASVIAGLEPVYGLFLAFLLLHEIPALRTLLGGSIIVLCAAFMSMRGNPDSQD